MTCSQCGQPDEQGCGCVPGHSLLGFLQDFRTNTVSRPAPPAESPPSQRRTPADRPPSAGAPLNVTIHAPDLAETQPALQAAGPLPDPATNAPQPWDPELAQE